MTLAWRARALAQGVRKDRTKLYLYYCAFGSAFASSVARTLESGGIDPAHHAYFGFTNGCLETLELFKERGAFTLVDQVSPGRKGEQLYEEEVAKFRGWEPVVRSLPELYYERVGREWQLADRVLVNSEWSASALVEQGVPREKLLVVPLAYEARAIDVERRAAKNHSGPLRVLWLGNVNLLKGIAYLLQAARLLKPSDVQFDVAGPIAISREALASAPGHVTFYGRITRDRVATFYRNADVFVLPTLSDGFAITQIEAMAHGLPVIATGNCGQVVRHDLEGPQCVGLPNRRRRPKQAAEFLLSLGGCP
jgi:hypothetical protein